MTQKQQRIFLLTGASGFIGSFLARELVKRGENVHLLLRQNCKTWRLEDILNKVTVHEVDLIDSNKLTSIIHKIKPTIIYHLAAYGAYSFQNEGERIFQNNIIGTLNVLNACNDINYELFVNTGSSSEYGFQQKPMKETTLPQPNSYYAISKCAQTHLCNFEAATYHKPIVTFRLFSAYGPYEEPSRFIPTLLRALYCTQEINLVSAQTARDMIYVGDIVNLYLNINILKHFSGHIFNLGTGIQSTIEDIVSIAKQITGKTTVFNWDAMTGKSWDSANWVADIHTTKSLLNWEPRYDLEHGLVQTWDWFKKNHHYYTQG